MRVKLWRWYRSLAQRLASKAHPASSTEFFPPTFVNSERYWEERYRGGGHSGVGSLGMFAEFKARTLNGFVQERGVTSVIEFGCGDGQQLSLATYPRYHGIDVSESAVELCRSRFRGDTRLTFTLACDYDGRRADLAISLDVIYHLVEDDVYHAYMHRLFDSAERYVAVYSSDFDQVPETPHVRHRRFTDWVKANRADFVLELHVANEYPYRGDYRTGSFADFYFFRRTVGYGDSARIT